MTELEKTQRAKIYLEKLADGINPITNKKESEDSVLNNVRLSRCFFYVANILDKVIENGGQVGKKIRVLQLPFVITKEQISAIETTEEPVGISVFAKRVAKVTSENVKPISAMEISNWLIQNGYLKEIITYNKRQKIVSAKGEELGIATIDVTTVTGISYKKNIYPLQAQKFIIENLEKIAKDLENEK